MREFSIDSRDMKTRLACYVWEPGVEAKAILVLAHGMQEHMMRYTEIAEYLVSQNIIFAGLDHLGHGKSAATTDDFGYFCEQDPATVLVRDVHRLKKTVQAEHPGIPVFLMGHSMGSFIARNYIERYGTGIQGVIIQGGGDTPWIIGAGGKMLTGTIALFHGWRYRSPFCDRIVLGAFDKAFTGEHSWICGREEVVKQFLEDPLTDFTFTLNGYHTLSELTLRSRSKKLIARIPKELPMLILSGAEDPVGEMGKGVQRMYELYKNCGMKNVKLDIRPGDRHELHHEEDRYKVFEEIKEFIL
ncbi:MAG: lysophospholipase [Lachnospiraceae bacterium]|nr:lysophospholipase [Lachnospiraceae bacterium]